MILLTRYGIYSNSKFTIPEDTIVCSTTIDIISDHCVVKPIFKWVAENRFLLIICAVSFDKSLKLSKTLSQGNLIFYVQKAVSQK